jgi:L-fuconolactonase
MSMIIDAHHHLWQYNTEDYGWMDDSMAVLKQDYLPADLEKQLSGTGVSGTVAVQARQKPEETRWLLGQAAENPFIKGIVGWVDLRSEQLNKQLSEFGNHPLLRGVRHVIHDEPDDDFMLRPDFLRGIELLQKFSLTYDLLLFPKHLERAVELAGRFPDQKFVLDHMAKPFIRSGVLDPWRGDIAALAEQPNVWCKISGMVTEADLNSWKYKDFIPYLDTVLDAFGTGRIMLGSDWPVCRLAAEYRDVMEIPLCYFESFSPEEKNKIFYQNCIDFYQLQ